MECGLDTDTRPGGEWICAYLEVEAEHAILDPGLKVASKSPASRRTETYFQNGVSFDISIFTGLMGLDLPLQGFRTNPPKAKYLGQLIDSA